MREMAENKDFENLKQMDTTKWTTYLDCDGFEKGTPGHLHVIFRWCFVKRMIERYQEYGNNEGPWSQPLCKVEIPILMQDKQKFNDFDIAHCNVYHPARYAK